MYINVKSKIVCFKMFSVLNANCNSIKLLKKNKLKMVSIKSTFLNLLDFIIWKSFVASTEIVKINLTWVEQKWKGTHHNVRLKRKRK